MRGARAWWGPWCLAGAVVCGVVAGEHVGSVVSATLLGLAASVVVGVHAATRSPRSGRVRRWLMVLTLVGVASCAAGRARGALDDLERSPLRALVAERADVTVTGALAEDPQGSRFATRALVRVGEGSRGDGAGNAFPGAVDAQPGNGVRDGDWFDGGGATVLVLATDEAAQRVGLLSAGDRVTLGGWLRPLEGYERRLRWRHAVGHLEASRLLAFSAPHAPLMRGANGLRSLVLGGAESLPAAERSLLAGMLLGDTRGLAPATVERFRASGLSHLLAVSGSNVAFVLGLVGPILRRLRPSARLLAALLVVLVFAAMTRFEPSVLRAAAMAALTMVALHLGRPQPALRVLALAVGVLLLVDPFLLHSVGFLLSCAACLGLALLATRLRSVLRGPSWLRESLGAAIAAQIGVAPVLVPVFGSLPLASLPANVLAAPLAGPITVLGFVAAVVSGAAQGAAPALGGVLLAPVGLMLRALDAVAVLGASVPVRLGPSGLAWCAGGGGVLVALRRAKRMLRRDGRE